MEAAEEVFMGSIFSISGSFWGEKEGIHVLLLVIPEKRGVVDPPVFPHILGIAATFLIFDAVVVFAQLKTRDVPGRGIKIGGPLANVVELSSADNGTLMLVKIPFTQGTKYQIVPIEDIKEIAYSP